MRTRIAILMAVIATFGAVVAFRAVTAEEDTSSDERRLEQGQILELNRRADLLNTYRESAQFQESENLARSRGFYLQQQAKDLRDANPSAANTLDLQAEEQFAIARMYRRIGRFIYVSIDQKDTLEVGIEKNVARELSDAGFGAVWVNPPPGELPNIWRDLQKDIAVNRNKTVWLSGLVAMFVLALAFLTFTQLATDGSRLQLWLERIAYIIALGASFACFLIDHQSWLLFLLAGLGIALVAFAGNALYSRPAVTHWLTGPKPVPIPKEVPEPKAEADVEGKGQVESEAERGEGPAAEHEEEPSHPHEVGPRVAFIGSHLLAWDCTSTMNRFALTLIAVTALLAAICGWRYDCASAFANGAAGRAMDQQVVAFKEFARRQTAIHYEWGVEARMHEARMRFKAAEQRIELARQNLFGVTADREPSQMAWQKYLLSEKRESDAVEQLDGERGPELDPYYPQKEAELTSREDSEIAFAKWDAENALRQEWHAKASQYLLTLTMFAIALYLLGQSMGMGLGRGAFILVLGGSLISGVGAFLAAKTAVRYLPRDARKVESAADFYGKGRQLYLVAHAPDDYAQAAEQFHKALGIRPNFALAHYYYGESLYNSARVHPDEPDTLPSRQTGVLGKTVAEMTISLDVFKKQGVTPPEELVGRYGFFTLLQSLSPPDINMMRKGITVLKNGIKSYPKDVWLEANLAVSLLLSGKTEEARKAYDQVFADGVWPGLAIGALGDLEIAYQYCGVFPHVDCATIKSEIAKLKPRFALVAGPKPKGADWETSDASLSDAELLVSPAVVSWKATVNAKRDRDVLVVIWYRRDPEWGAWRVISSVSGKVGTGPDTNGPETLSFALSFLDAMGQHQCLDTGDYRAEFYINGKLVAQPTKSLQSPHEFKGIGLHDINFEACYPATWSDWAYTPTDVTGPELVRGSTSPDKKRGIYLFTYFYPNIPNKSGAIIEQAVARSEKIMEAQGMPHNLVLKPLDEACSEYPVDYLTEGAVWYQDSTQTATARAWIAKDGIVYVAIAANGARNGLDADACMIMTSLSNIDAPAVPPAPQPPPAAPSRAISDSNPAPKTRSAPDAPTAPLTAN